MQWENAVSPLNFDILVFLNTPTGHPLHQVKNKKTVTWFNPPFNINIATNVGREFLKLIDEHFPPGHPLHQVINRQTVKVGYRCLPNMGPRSINITIEFSGMQA